MAVPNVYQELKNVLTSFKALLDEHVGTIKPAVGALSSAVPQVDDLLQALIDLTGKLRTSLANLDVNVIPGLDRATEFVNAAKALLETSKKMLPEEAGKIDTALDVVAVVASVPSLNDIKAEVLGLIDAVLTHLRALKAA